ncbi:MAG: hypothetical protein A2Y62_01800 [Candidatus Fischerbacteria bacterium RBG_13_37_8]|uniref:Polymerase beta nucleotidyltransferase domain-containing protein n=1 Tax=Candidatus Fischerbacteria bacterium RBG_13_37_8 TaxID=1817863 RepID=A0A1F5VDV9_9BACT|nr:MAG: hypothetical protein A2Y62_01800 [Candidatus Fischerbacteria bacterium RBG_13_37_8]
MKVKKLTPEIIKEIVKRIVSTSHPEKIILFGSHANGIPSGDSDVDLLVIKRRVGSKIEEYTRIRKSLKGIRIPMDIIVINSKEYDFYSRNWINSVMAEAKERGIILYGD